MSRAPHEITDVALQALIRVACFNALREADYPRDSNAVRGYHATQERLQKLSQLEAEARRRGLQRLALLASAAKLMLAEPDPGDRLTLQIIVFAANAITGKGK